MSCGPRSNARSIQQWQVSSSQSRAHFQALERKFVSFVDVLKRDRSDPDSDPVFLLPRAFNTPTKVCVMALAHGKHSACFLDSFLAYHWFFVLHTHSGLLGTYRYSADLVPFQTLRDLTGVWHCDWRLCFHGIRNILKAPHSILLSACLYVQGSVE